jgi:hypothetical protein
VKVKLSTLSVPAIFCCACLLCLCPASHAQGDPSPSGAFAGQVPVSAALKKTLSSKDSKVDEEISAVIEKPVTIGTTELPKGSLLLGHVVSLTPHTKDTPNGSITIVFDHAQPKKGSPVDITSSVYKISLSVDQARAQQPDVDMGMRGSANEAQATQAVEHNTGLQDPKIDGMVSKAGAPVQVVSAVPGVALSAVASDDKSAIMTSRNRDVFLDGGTELVVGVKLK